MSKLEMISGVGSEWQSFCGALQSCLALRQDLQDLCQCPCTNIRMEFWSGFSLVIASLLALVMERPLNCWAVGRMPCTVC